MRHAKLFVLLFSMQLACAGQAQAQSPDAASIMSCIEAPQKPDRGGYDSYSLRALMERLGVRGISIAVIRDFKIHWTKAYGIADISSGAPVDNETLFQAASIGKSVAAMAVLRAVQDRKFSLDG